MRGLRILTGALHGLRRNGVRTLFMMLGPFVGVAALTGTMSYGRDTQQRVLNAMDRMLSGSSILLRAGASTARGGPHGSVMTRTLTLADVDAVERAVPPVRLADPFIMTGGREVVYEGRSTPVSLVGHSAASEQAWYRTVTRGDYFSKRDVARAARVALVGETVVRDVFGGRDPVGEQVRIGAVPFEVIGVLERVGVDPHGIDKDNEVMIPVTTLMRRVLNVDFIAGAKLLVDPDANLDAVVLAIEDVLRARHGLGPDQDNDFTLFTPVQVKQMVESANRVFTLFLPIVASLSIVVGGLVVANLTLLGVAERRGEIGLRVAIGARARDIRLQFLAEAALVAGAGGVLAVGLAWLVMATLTFHAGQALQMPWDGALLGVLITLAIGAVAGVLPARRAAALAPADVLR